MGPKTKEVLAKFDKLDKEVRLRWETAAVFRGTEDAPKRLSENGTVGPEDPIIQALAEDAGVRPGVLSTEIHRIAGVDIPGDEDEGDKARLIAEGIFAPGGVLEELGKR